MKCRDFSGPDSHSSRFPREGIPTQDTNWLAHALADPFPSLTDKARALFTWMHHNIAYDTKSFFSGNLQPSTPASTMLGSLRRLCKPFRKLCYAYRHGSGCGFRPRHGLQREEGFRSRAALTRSDRARVERSPHRQRRMEAHRPLLGRRTHRGRRDIPQEFPR